MESREGGCGCECNCPPRRDTHTITHPQDLGENLKSSTKNIMFLYIGIAPYINICTQNMVTHRVPKF